MYIMKTQKLSPTDKKNIVTRVLAGERQVDMAKEFGVSEGLISRIVKQAKEVSDGEDKPTRKDLSGKTSEQLRNRYTQCHRDIRALNEELVHTYNTIEGKIHSVKEETERLSGISDAEYRKVIEQDILAQKGRIAYLKDTEQLRITYVLAARYNEVTNILFELGKRQKSGGDGSVPWSSEIDTVISKVSRVD